MKFISKLFFFVVGLLAGLNLFAIPEAPQKAAPINQATVYFENTWRTIKQAFFRGLMQVQLAVDHVFGMRTPFALGVETVDEQILKSLGGLNERMKQLDALDTAIKKNSSDYEQVTKVIDAVKLELDAFRKQQLGLKQRHVARHGEEVSSDCAAFLGGIMLATGLQQGKFSGKQLDMAEIEVKNLLGVHAKAALTSSDIPLPTQYSGDVVELVYQYGQGRKLATVFPMGALTVKLPKLTTDTTFSLVAASGTVTEKSPQVGFVTFTAEKFGGLIRLPQEIDEDSIVSMGQFLGRYTARNIARVEDVQVFTSTGADSGANGAGPGLIAAANTDSCTYALSGSTSGGKTAISQATLADFRILRAQVPLVLNQAKYYLHPTFEQLLVSFNTSATVQPYQRKTATTPATLDGYPIEFVNVMPVYTSTASVSTGYALFGDATYQYLGLRNGIRFDTSREAAFTTDEILVRAVERLTVGYMASKAVAVLQTDAS